MKFFGIVLVAGWVLAVLVAVSNSAPIAVDFRDSALVDGPEARLGDVAQITGDEPDRIEKLRNCIVASSLVAGFTRAISTNHIKAYRLRGENLSGVEFRNEGKVYLRMDVRKVDGETIRQQVETFLAANMPWKAEDARVRLKHQPDGVVLPNRPTVMRVESEAEFSYLGAGKCRVSFEQQGKAVKTAWVPVEVQVCADVCVAARTIARGEIVSACDVAMERKNITRMRHAPLREASLAAGKRSKRTIARGRIIDPTLIELPPAVESGQTVELCVKRGSATIRVDGVSRSDGQVGDVIPVYCQATKRILKGCVQPGGGVLIREPRRD